MLGTDYVDIWHLHARDTPAAIPEEALEAMVECKKSGKARFLGFSCHDPNNMADFLIKTGKFDVMQTTYSYPIGGIYRDQAIKKLHEAGIGVIAMNRAQFREVKKQSRSVRVDCFSRQVGIA